MGKILNFNEFLNEEFNFDEVDKARIVKQISGVTTALKTAEGDEHKRLSGKLITLKAELSKITGVDEKIGKNNETDIKF